MNARYVLLAVVLASGLMSGVAGAELELRHSNDLFSGSATEDDLYSATVGISGTVRGWTLDLEEFIFTDRTNGQRFDETYLTVARELLPQASRLSLRARVGVAHVGEGLFGQDAQNLVHQIVNQPKVELPYVLATGTHGFARLNLERVFNVSQRLRAVPLAEVEAAGFKRHAKAAVRGEWDLPRRFEFTLEGGWRWTRSDYAALDPWIDESDPTYAAGIRYARYVELRWSANHFGTADRHWNIVVRIPMGRRSGTTAP